MAGRVRQALLDALNGGVEQVDPAVRRGLTSLATAADDIESRFDRLEAGFDALRKTVLGVGGSILTALLTATGAVILQALR